MIDALGGTRRTSGGSVAGPTAFHRAKSWPPRDKRIVRRGWVSATWHIYDNKGSYNGWFDTLPEWMRMGPWAPMAFVFMFILYGSLLSCPPQPLVFPASPTSGTWWWADVCVFLWGCIVVVEGWRHLSMLAFAVSYTGWSWCILTSRAGLCALAPILEPHAPAAAAWAAAAGSALRFPALAAAVITFTVWNTMLLPILYLLILPQQARPNFLKFNFGFFMVNVHVFNLPLAAVNTLIGDGARPFTSSDLYAALLVVGLYSALYLFVLDRLGLHFYPMFCPRSNSCALSFGLVLVLYYYILQGANAAMAGWRLPPAGAAEAETPEVQAAPLVFCQRIVAMAVALVRPP